ncbi:arginine--tRNA ligase, chloroplastic/mitochondrial, partial [Tanacetum coccineum]
METKYVTIATIAGVSEFQSILPGPADGFAALNVFRADDYAPHISLLAVACVIFITYHHRNGFGLDLDLEWSVLRIIVAGGVRFIRGLDDMEDNLGERRRLLDWSSFVCETIVVDPPPHIIHISDWAHSTSDNTAPDEHKRLVKRPHSTARIAAPGERKRWSPQEEVTKPFEIAMKRVQREIKQNALKLSYPGERYPDLTQEHRIYNYKGEPGVYQCQNALWIWAKLINCLTSSQLNEGPKYVGEKIKEKFPESDMIEERPSMNEFGFVTIKLSGKWIAKSIHKTLRDVIDTWAPKLPVERWDGILPEELNLKRWFLCEKSEGDVVIKGKAPFILPKRDFENANEDFFVLWYGLHEHKADWIVYMTPVRKQVCAEMCLAAAKLAGWISSDRHKPPRTSYAGYRTCTTEMRETLLEEAKSRCLAVSKGEAAKLLAYSAEAVLDCVFRYTSLINHRLAVCTFDLKMFNEKASEFILEKDKGWEKGEERVLGFHLLEFTE